MSPAEIRAVIREAISLESQARHDAEIFAENVIWDEPRVAALHIHHILQHYRAHKTIHLWDDAPLAIKETKRPEITPVIAENIKQRSLEVIQYWIQETQRHSDQFRRYAFESPSAAVHAA